MFYVALALLILCVCVCVVSAFYMFELFVFIVSTLALYFMCFACCVFFFISRCGSTFPFDCYVFMFKTFSLYIFYVLLIICHFDFAVVSVYDCLLLCVYLVFVVRF